MTATISSFQNLLAAQDPSAMKEESPTNGNTSQALWLHLRAVQRETISFWGMEEMP